MNERVPRKDEPMKEANRERLRLLHRLEQIEAGLRHGDPESEKAARGFMAQLAINGTIELLAHVYSGIILARDSENAEWEKLFEEEDE